MKEVKTFILVDFVVLIVKLLGGFLCHSTTILASAIYDVALILVSLLTLEVKDNNKVKGIVSSLVGFIIVLLGIGVVFFSFIHPYEKTSLFIILFVLLSLILRYVVGCFYTNVSYQKGKGLLNYGRVQSTVDFIGYGVILGAMILSKLSRWGRIFKYADAVGTIILAIFVVLKGVKVIRNSIWYLEEKEFLVSDEVKTEITNRSEVKKLDSLEVQAFGGIKKASCNVVLNAGISMVDINTFVVTLQDYLLRVADVVKINLISPSKGKTKTKTKVRSLKQDARNSRSGNSKTNTKKKNSKQKNKKR